MLEKAEQRFALPPPGWELPALAQDARASLSCDGQVYWLCDSCGAVNRVSWELLSSLAPERTPCGSCMHEGLVPIRHLARVTWRCSDCNALAAVTSDGFDRPRCPECHSMDLTVVDCEVAPPFPSRFHDIVFGHTWGVEANDDIQVLIPELQHLAGYPDFAEYLVIYARLCARLSTASYPSPSTWWCQMSNYEANLLWEACRRGHDVEVGVQAHQLFREIYESTTNDFMRVAVGFNVAGCAHTLISRFGNEVVSLLTATPDLASEACGICKSLIAYWQGETSPTATEQACRLYILLGDLTANKAQSDSEIHEALDFYRQAQSVGISGPRLQHQILESTGCAIAKLTVIPEELEAHAKSALDAVASSDEGGRAWTEKIVALGALAAICARHDDRNGRLRHLREAGRLAANEIASGFATDVRAIAEGRILPRALQDRASAHGRTFDALTDALAQAGDEDGALMAAETQRAGSLRIWTMPRSQISAIERSAGEHITKASISRLLGDSATGDVPPIIDVTSGSDLSGTARRLGAALLSVSMWQGTTTVVAIGTKGQPYDLFRWTPPPEACDKLVSLANQLLEPSPLREGRVRAISALATEVLLEPPLRALADAGLQRLAVSLPAILLRVPLEAGLLDGKPLVDQFALAYTPSLGALGDLTEREHKHRPQRLLVVGYGGDDLSAVEDELDQICKAWGTGVEVIAGKSCTKKAVCSVMGEPFDMIHFACHGSFDALRPLHSALHLDKAQRSANSLTALDILGVRLQCSPVVTLSACSSALTSIGSSNSCVGLLGSFLRAGARAVVGSRWKVRDTAAKDFMTGYYSCVKTRDVFDAFVTTQRGLSRGSLETWAAFSYIGSFA